MEMDKEALSEYFHMLMDPEISNMKSKIMMKMGFQKKVQKKKNEKMGQLLEKMNKLQQNTDEMNIKKRGF